MPGEITAGFKFGEAVAKLWHTWIKSKDKRKLEAGKKAAQNYIRANERSGRFKNTTDEKKLKLLAHYAKRFWHYS